MSQEQVQVVFALCGGDSVERKKVSQAISKYCKGKCTHISLSKVVERYACNPKIFGLSSSYFLKEEDVKFDRPILVRDGNLRYILRNMFVDLGNDYNCFNPTKIGLNHFRQMLLKSRDEVMAYISLEVMRKAYVNFIPEIAYNNYTGQYGIYIIQDIQFKNELVLAQDYFQLVYPVSIKGDGRIKSNCKQVDDFEMLREDIVNTICSFAQIKVHKDNKKIDEEICKLCKDVEEDVSLKIENKDIKPLKFRAIVDKKGNIEQTNGSGSFQYGNATFAKRESRLTDDEIIT